MAQHSRKLPAEFRSAYVASKYNKPIYEKEKVLDIIADRVGRESAEVVLSYMLELFDFYVEENLSEKTCNSCGETKSVDDFYKRTASIDGLQTYCKPCSLGMMKNPKNKANAGD